MRYPATISALSAAFLFVGAYCRTDRPKTTIRQESNLPPNQPTEPHEHADSTQPPDRDSPPADIPQSNVLNLEPLTTVEGTLDEKQSARAIGTFDKTRNKLAFQLRNVSAFSIDLARIPVDWNRPVVLSLDRVPVELRRRDTQRLHFTRNPQGAWLIVEPPKNP